MLLIALHFILGVILAGAYSELPPALKFTYAWGFPLHWLGMKWIQSVIREYRNNPNHPILDNGPLWAVIVLMLLFLYVIGSGG